MSQGCESTRVAVSCKAPHITCEDRRGAQAPDGGAVAVAAERQRARLGRRPRRRARNGGAATNGGLRQRAAPVHDRALLVYSHERLAVAAARRRRL